MSEDLQKQKPEKKHILIEVCHGKSCTGRCARLIKERAENEIEFRNIPNMKVEKTNCLGHCERGPNVRVTYATGTQEIKNRMSAIEMGKTIKNISP